MSSGKMGVYVIFLCFCRLADDYEMTKRYDVLAPPVRARFLFFEREYPSIFLGFSIGFLWI